MNKKSHALALRSERKGLVKKAKVANSSADDLREKLRTWIFLAPKSPFFPYHTVVCCLIPNRQQNAFPDLTPLTKEPSPCHLCIQMPLKKEKKKKKWTQEGKTEKTMQPRDYGPILDHEIARKEPRRDRQELLSPTRIIAIPSLRGRQVDTAAPE